MNQGVQDERRLLDVWSHVAVLARPGKEVAILAAVTGHSTEQCARWPVGERDRQLMALHARTFGDRYDCETQCPACGNRMAFGFAATDLGLSPVAVDADALILTEGRVVVKLRLPNSDDIAACMDTPHPARQLFTRCVKVQSSPAHKPGQLRTDNLPASLRQSAIERLAALDPFADLMFELECPSCAHDTKVMFDPVVALLVQAGQDASFMHKATLQDVQSGPSASSADFLERLMRRHLYDATVHPLTG
jgi:hypothetical protein